MENTTDFALKKQICNKFSHKYITTNGYYTPISEPASSICISIFEDDPATIAETPPLTILPITSSTRPDKLNRPLRPGTGMESITSCMGCTSSPQGTTTLDSMEGCSNCKVVSVCEFTFTRKIIQPKTKTMSTSYLQYVQKNTI